MENVTETFKTAVKETKRNETVQPGKYTKLLLQATQWKLQHTWLQICKLSETTAREKKTIQRRHAPETHILCNKSYTI